MSRFASGYQVQQPDAPTSLFGYDVLDFIGEGAGSLLYVVSDPQSLQVFALKYVRIRGEADRRYAEQLANEFDVGQRLGHPNLRKTLRRFDNGTLFRKATEVGLLMELVDGTPMDAWPVPPVGVALDALYGAATGLAAMQQAGFVHCDVKPSNILVTGDGVKVIDFGQACAANTVKERVQGTADFIAPEQCRREAVTLRTDVFNFGATMYWFLTRRPIPTLYTVKRDSNSFLVDGRIASPREIIPTVPENLSNLVMDCVRTNPSQRPESMAELVRRIEVVQFAIARTQGTIRAAV